MTAGEIPNKLKVIYFPIRNRGAVLRSALRMCEIPYEYVKIPFAEWPPLKPTVAGGSLPVVRFSCPASLCEVSKTVTAGSEMEMGQLLAICIYAARLTGKLVHTNPYYEARMFEVIGVIEDMLAAFKPSIMSSDPEEKQRLRKNPLQELPARLKSLETCIAMSGTTSMKTVEAERLAAAGDCYSVGDAVSLADLYVYFFCKNFFVDLIVDGVPAGMLKAAPCVERVVKTMEKNPHIIACLAE